METQSVPLRNYLMTHVMPILTKGLIECCKQKPEDPIDYLVSSQLSAQTLSQQRLICRISGRIPVQEQPTGGLDWPELEAKSEQKRIFGSKI